MAKFFRPRLHRKAEILIELRRENSTLLRRGRDGRREKESLEKLARDTERSAEFFSESRRRETIGRILDMEPRREGLLGLLHNSMQDYMRLRGVGEAKALQLVAIGELSKRIWRREAAKNLTTAFSDPGLCARYYMEALRHLEQEELHAAFLDTKLRFISDQLLSRGSVDASVVSVRELMIAALRARAVRMILVHNHPSGDPRPSADDQRVTVEVQTAAKLIGIPLEDHIVIGDNAYYSFKEWGLL